MITAAISEPSDTFDGKVGMLFHGEVIPARRNSVRRPAATPKIHPIVVIREFQRIFGNVKT